MPLRGIKMVTCLLSRDHNDYGLRQKGIPPKFSFVWNPPDLCVIQINQLNDKSILPLFVIHQPWVAPTSTPFSKDGEFSSCTLPTTSLPASTSLVNFVDYIFKCISFMPSNMTNKLRFLNFQLEPVSADSLLWNVKKLLLLVLTLFLALLSLLNPSF